jgi:hypothetical protein
VVGSAAADDSSVDPRHALIIGAWIMTREASLLVSYLIGACPLPSASCGGAEQLTGASLQPRRGFVGRSVDSDLVELCSLPVRGDDDVTAVWLVGSWDVTVTGASLLAALLSLKHIGCIYNVAVSLREVCTRLCALKPGIKIGSTGPTLQLNDLPRAWLDFLLSRVQSATQFILRR